MKWIETSDLRKWADTRDCQESLPHLIRKLIRATTSSIKNIKFPSGDNVLIGGWDGVLEVTEETEYIPVGRSVWEFGSNAVVKRKADSDYTKRTENPLGCDPSDTTYVFVTPRLWTKADNWVAEKKGDNVWKDIKVINAETLEEWLEITPSVASWFAIKHLSKYPQGVQSAEDFWEEWAAGPSFNLNADILLGGRTAQVEKLIGQTTSAKVVEVQGASREEALAFVISCFLASEERKEDFFSRSLIVDSLDVFRQVSVQNHSLYLIPRFEDEGVVNRAIASGHTVIIPVGADVPRGSNEQITLPRIARDPFVESLVDGGFSKEQAEKYSKESARNITILRRQLEFVRSVPQWANSEMVRDIFPALIVGRWDESFQSDKDIVASVAGENYGAYKIKLNRWLHTSDSPFIKIGTTWRLASPLDAWTNASRNLVSGDFDLLRSSFLEILSEINPAFELEPGERYMASLYGKERKYSEWIREGVTQSLILISLYGDELKLDLPTTAKAWVDNLARRVLDSNDLLVWRSIRGVLPLLSEASPDAFLEAVENNISQSDSAVVSLFDEEPGLMNSISYHSDLLWALESLAWFPEYLPRTAIVLAELSAVDPGGSTVNRPINSLSEIFKTWHYQTLADFEQRMSVLRLLIRKQPEIARKLLLRMIPINHESAMPTHQMRWRMFDVISRLIYTYEEIWKTHSAVIEMLISHFEASEEKLVDLVNISSKVEIRPQDREKILVYVDSAVEQIDHSQNILWHSVRKILSEHRSYPDAQWSLPKTTLDRYQQIYDKLNPSDLIQKIIWMFDEEWPSLSEGIDYRKRWEEGRGIIDQARTDGLKKVYEHYGVEKIIELSQTVKEPYTLGTTLGCLVNDESEILLISQEIRREDDLPRFAHGFINQMVDTYNQNWTFQMYDKLKKSGMSATALAHLFIPVSQSEEIWNFISTTDEQTEVGYWKKVIPHFYRLSIEEKIVGLQYLLEHRRYVSAIRESRAYVKELPSSLLASVLELGATEHAEEDIRISEYELQQIFEEIHARDDIDLQQLMKIEWLYLPILARSVSFSKPELLHKGLSTTPTFFIDVLKAVYQPRNEKLLEEEKNALSVELLSNRAMQAHQLLNSWKKIPGADNEGNLHVDYLTDWITEVRQLAREVYRLEVADRQIGRVLAQYPENTKPWPPEPICVIIENINTKELKEEFSVATTNKRSFSVRGPYDGGEHERGLARYFSELSELLSTSYPIVSRILSEISAGYTERARREDEEAERNRLNS